MSTPSFQYKELPPYSPPASPSDRHESSSGDGSNPGYNGHQHPRLAPWQRRWNVEWLNEAVIPHQKQKYLLLQNPRYIAVPFTRQDVDVAEDAASTLIARAIKAGCVGKESAHNRTRLYRVIRRWTWPLLLMVHEVKAFKKCWYEFKNKDKLWRVTAVMEEQGENPRWQAEMTFTIQPWQYDQMTEAGKWFEFPSPEDIKWFWITGPDGTKMLHANNQNHWGPTPGCLTRTQPFGEENGRIVRHPVSPILPEEFSLFVEQTGPQRCNHCGYMT